MEIINIIAVLLSPLIAVWVTTKLQDRAEKRKHKMELFRRLLLANNAFYQLDLNDVSMFNMINVYFYDNKKIRQLWKECYELFCSTDINIKLVENKRSELLFEIARNLGYGKAITHLDFGRIYYPKGIADKDEIDRNIKNELLRVLKNSDAIVTVTNKNNNQSA